MSHRRSRLMQGLAPVAWAGVLCCATLLAPAAAQPGTAGDAPAAGEPAAAPPAQSVLDDRLFYQLLVSEMALRQGDAGTAYEWMLDAARRTRDEGLFRRAVDIALQARAGDQALTASRAWRQARPESLDALRLQLQILLLLNRSEAVAEPLKALLAQTPPAERAGLIAALPRFLQRANDPTRVAALVAEAVKPYQDDPATRVSARVALGRAWLDAREPDRALALAQQAQGLDPTAAGPALLALELMRERPAAEALVQSHLRQADAEPMLRLAYVRVLTAAQRYADAVVQLETATRLQPTVAAPYLSLGALYLELKQVAKGEAALLRYVELAQAGSAPVAQTAGGGVATERAGGDAAGGVIGAAEDSGEDPDAPRPDQGLVQARLMLAQAAEQRGDFKAAEAWLAQVGDPQRALDVQARRASMLARQGQVDKAREIIRQLPERDAEQARAKIVAEAGLLRDVRQWQAAFEVLAAGVQRFGDDTDLIYEQAMMAEKLNRLDEMERLLRRVIELKPDNAHAHNALGYSLGDRNLRLPEARALVQRALDLAPGDPFIIDSLGWIEYRMGNLDTAARLLRQAYAARPDTEIGAHLGEVLWALGERDEARRVWRDAKARDAANDVLLETLARLRVDL